MIKFVDPQVGIEEKKALNAVIDSKYLAEGPVARDFEKRFGEFVGSKYTIVTSNGTTALHLALEATGIKPGDEVITTPFTFIASSNSILFNGAIPIFADIDPETYNIDPEKVEEKITKKTKAILPVHIFGNPCDMKALTDIAKDHDLKILEDACQSHGAFFDGKHTGTIGEVGCFSFYASKNLPFGEGGAIVTDNEELKDEIMCLRNHGRTPKGGYFHTKIGYNYRTSNIHAAIGVEQMKKLPEMLEARKRNANILLKELSDLDGFAMQEVYDNAQHGWYIAAGRTDRKDLPVAKVIEELKANNIGSRQIYNVPSYEQPAYTELNNYYYWSEFIKFPDYSKVSCPVAERVGKDHFQIPINPGVSEEDMQHIVATLKKIFS
ncbi:MAG: DegT/DnrJ/EryC1/StrS family aminotransferase [Candidatus Heimdallarchaeota archaeon]|nr:DegT/DnrJ/EryC1/StrS family aminotransferase [Candidatus Heimdallarchaeota archaeon]MBY8993013.1 DegT/DnrJ/EryC1/StrS family aminotransferase [Candidatus Heimdallarchaeota archaeon]